MRVIFLFLVFVVAVNFGDALQAAKSRLFSNSRVFRLAATATVVEAPPSNTKQVLDTARKHQSNCNNDGGSFLQLRLYNDTVNYQEWIALCLVRIAGATELHAYRTMMQAHRDGQALIGIYPMEQAEHYKDALREQGLNVKLHSSDE